MKKSFVLYNDQRNVFEALSEKECKELLLAIFDFAEGVEKPLSPIVKIAFISIRNQLKRDFEKWEYNSEIRKEFGRRGGIAKASKSQLKPVLLSKPAVNVNVNVIDKNNTPIQNTEVKNKLVAVPEQKPQTTTRAGFSLEQRKKLFNIVDSLPRPGK